MNFTDNEDRIYIYICRFHVRSHVLFMWDNKCRAHVRFVFILELLFYIYIMDNTQESEVLREKEREQRSLLTYFQGA